ncbi:hypothetical protein TNCV_3954041 [Trichonephila clavipes]|nr:hypothetical protein TNCV_3954041 [Trichonephila clavipes]
MGLFPDESRFCVNNDYQLDLEKTMTAISYYFLDPSVYPYLAVRNPNALRVDDKAKVLRARVVNQYVKTILFPFKEAAAANGKTITFVRLKPLLITQARETSSFSMQTFPKPQ